MASYPPGKFVQEFAKRTHENLLDLRKSRPLSYKDTALIGSLLAVFVLPHERADDREFMGGLLDGFGGRELEEIVRVLKIAPNAKKADTESLPGSIGDIPRFLRHAIAHLNIKPESADGQSLTHLLIWNTEPKNKGGKITFVARIHIGRLRGLARHVLKQLSLSSMGDRYDGIDPIAKFDMDHETAQLAMTGRVR